MVHLNVKLPVIILYIGHPLEFIFYYLSCLDSLFMSEIFDEYSMEIVLELKMFNFVSCA